MALVDPKFDSSLKMEKECVLSAKGAEPSQSVLFVPSIENSISIHSQVSAAAEQGCTEIFPGNEDQNSINIQEKVEIPCSLKNTALSQKNYAYESGQVAACSCNSQPSVGGSLYKPRSLGTGTNKHAAGSVSLLGSKSSKITVSTDSANRLNLKPNPFTSSYIPCGDSKPLKKAPYQSSGFQSVASVRRYNNSRTISSGSQSVASVRCHNNSHTIPSLSGEGQVELLGRGNLMKQRVTGQVDHGSNHFGVNQTHFSRKNNDFFSEKFRGPRARSKCSLSSSTRKGNITNLLHRDNYNKADFQIEYEEAKFFMIKSYTEDDVHKSIKYNVWASTPIGNKKLDAAFWAADRVVEKGLKCPIFLFFSVNASGQFVGLAEMVGPVDFKKNMDFWQEEIWNGFFPVKWHIIKDIPSRLFQNITVENNDNKVVTFSKDTQEIGLPQGLQMLQIFKYHQPRTTLLDDFEFYEQQQKSLQARRGKRHAMLDSEFCDDNNSSMEHLETAVSEMHMAGKPTLRPALMSSPSSTRKFNNHWQPRS